MAKVYNDKDVKKEKYYCCSAACLKACNYSETKTKGKVTSVKIL